MREYPEGEEVDFAIVGTGAGGGTLACRLAEAGFSVVAFDAGPYWRPLEDFASDETEQSKLYWTDERIVEGDEPLTMGANNSGKSVGGSTVHFAMVSLRFRPEWFLSRSRLGYGADWPIDWREMWDYYRQVERALHIAGPVTYPWGPKRPRYPLRAHPLNAPAEYLARGAEALGIGWSETPLATLSAPIGRAHPCVYRGFCTSGCSTNAKQSVLTTWLPRALAAGAEIRDLAMVGRIETKGGRCTGVHYHRARADGASEWRFQKARNVVVAGYAIETPRLLLGSANGEFPDGLANSSGLVGRNLMVQTNQATWGMVEDEVRSYKGPPSLAISEHWNYADEGKDYQGRVVLHEPGAAAGGLGQDAGLGPRPVGSGAGGRDGAGEPFGGPQDGGRSDAERAQPRDAGRGARPVRPRHPAHHLLLRRERQGAGAARGGVHGRGARSGGGGRERWREMSDTCHLNGTARMGFDAATSVVDADCRSWDIANLWVCDGSVFPTVGGVNPSLTIQAIACRTADRIAQMARRGEL